MEEKCANTNQKLRGTEKWRNLSLNIQIVHALQLRNFQHRFAPALRRNLRYSGNFFAFRRDSLRWTRNRRGRGMWGFDARKSILTAYCSSEIPTTVPFPASPKTALWWEFLRFPPRLASLDSRRRGSGESGGEKSISPAYSSRKTAEILVFQGLSAVFRCVQFGPDRAKISTFRHLGAGTAAGTKSGLKWADCSQTRPRLAGSRWLWRSRK